MRLCGLRLDRWFLALLLLVLVLSGRPGPAAASFSYQVPEQSDTLTVGTDGTVSMDRTFIFAVNSSSSDNGTEIWAGLPTAYTKVTAVTDSQGKDVRFRTSSNDGEIVVILTGFDPIKPGSSRGFRVQATITNFIYQDARDSAYATMNYYPGWWSAPVGKETVSVVAPPGATRDSLRYGVGSSWTELIERADGRLVASWDFGKLAAGQRAAVTLGFPASLLSSAPSRSGGSSQAPSLWKMILAVTGSTPVKAGLILGVVLVYLIIRLFGLDQYSSPRIAMDGVGVLKGLDPVEAAVLLRTPPEKVLSLILMGLVQKRLVRVKGAGPMALEVLGEADGKAPGYVHNFLAAINRVDGSLDRALLLKAYKKLVRGLVQRSRPYCRKDSEEYYRERVQEAWKELEAATAPHGKLALWEKDLGWFFLDPAVADKVEGQLASADSPFPTDYWMWTDLYEPYGLPGPAGPRGWLSPGWGALNRRLGEGLVPAPNDFHHAERLAWRPPTSSGPSGSTTGSCACACVSCACACACAGGGGCT